MFKLKVNLVLAFFLLYPLHGHAGRRCLSSIQKAEARRERAPAIVAELLEFALREKRFPVNGSGKEEQALYVRWLRHKAEVEEVILADKTTAYKPIVDVLYQKSGGDAASYLQWLENDFSARSRTLVPTDIIKDVPVNDRQPRAWLLRTYDHWGYIQSHASPQFKRALKEAGYKAGSLRFLNELESYVEKEGRIPRFSEIVNGKLIRIPAESKLRDKLQRNLKFVSVWSSASLRSKLVEKGILEE